VADKEMSLLAVRELSKSFGGVHAVQRVSFSLAAGELLAMIGPNGAGKTTCFNLINGQLEPDAGQVFFEQREIHGLAPRERCRLGIGRTFQVAAAFGSMTVRENVQLAALSSERRLNSPFSSFEGMPGERAGEILEQVGISALAGRQCAELAYGDLKRVELAVALAARPRLLLMDEPTAGMAAPERHSLMKLVAGISKEKGISVLFTEHDMDVVFQHADRVIVLAEGELIAQGSPAEVRADAGVRRVYLGEGGADA
jgi:branched-chain amino acid transport system ATP-binding protein